MSSDASPISQRHSFVRLRVSTSTAPTISRTFDACPEAPVSWLVDAFLLSVGRAGPEEREYRDERHGERIDALTRSPYRYARPWRLENDSAPDDPTRSIDVPGLEHPCPVETLCRPSADSRCRRTSPTPASRILLRWMLRTPRSCSQGCAGSSNDWGRTESKRTRAGSFRPGSRVRPRLHWAGRRLRSHRPHQDTRVCSPRRRRTTGRTARETPSKISWRYWRRWVGLAHSADSLRPCVLSLVTSSRHVHYRKGGDACIL